MITLISDVLFNCCTDNVEPDWTLFDALEIGGCISEWEGDEEYVTGGVGRAEAEFFTVYGHLKEGGVEALTDCRTLETARHIAGRLELLSGLKCEVLC